MRWDENFAAILREKGMNLEYSVAPDENGHWITNIEVTYQKEGFQRKVSLKTYIKEELDTSIHELFRGNVPLAT